MNFRRYFFLFCTITIPVAAASAQPGELKFSKLSVEQGLSHGNVRFVLQSKAGFMWVGTEDGLNLYDGYDFTIFRNKFGDSTTISDNFIHWIAEDKDENIWVGTQNGLNRYNAELGTFERFTASNSGLSNNNTHCVFFDSNENLWVGTAYGLNLYDRKRKWFTNFIHRADDMTSIQDAPVLSIAEDERHRIWIGTMGGLSLLNQDHSFTGFYASAADSQTLSSNKITTVFPQGDSLWIGTFDGGLNLLNIYTGKVTRYLHKNGDPRSLAGSYIYQMNINQHGELWVAVDGGLSVLDEDKNRFTNFINIPDDESSISSNNVTYVYFDNENRIWVGTRFGGLNIYDKGNFQFNRSKVKGDNVTSFAEDKSGNIWIATDGFGIHYYNRSTGKILNLKHDPQNGNSLASNKALAVKLDHKGDLWIGFWNGGLDHYDIASKRFKHYHHDPKNPKSLSDDNIFYIFEDSKNKLWVGTWGNGLNKYNEETDDFTSYVNDPNNPRSISLSAIGAICEDHDGNLWLGTDVGGLDKFDPSTEIFTHYEALGKKGNISSNAIFSVFEDSRHRIWAGSNGAGLNLLDPATGTFKTFRGSDGLPNEVISGILEDDENYLWLSTNNGLSKFDPVKHTFRNYGISDGLQDNQFNRWAYLKLNSGELLFGGIKGYNLFNPKNIVNNKFIPPVHITDFKLFSKSASIGKDGILKKHILLTKEIELNYKQNFFSFEFAALNFRHSEKNQYKYKLDGLQKDWIDAGTERKVSYTNLNPGEYTFSVIASNNDGIWNTTGDSIKIIITPPYWQTPWFVTLMILIVTGGVFLFIHVRTTSIRRQKTELERLVKERTEEVIKQKEEAELAKADAEQANKAKSIFLATMSHEIRTPMNGVIGMASLLSETTQTSEQQEYTETIRNCGESLLTVINDILDFSKIESGKMELESKAFDLRTCLEEVMDVFAIKAAKIGIDLVYEIDYNVPVKIMGDSLRLRQIILNLLGNAIKFTTKGEIFVGVHLLNRKDDQIQLGFEVRDTGIGIPEDKLDRLFKAFSQVDSSTTRKYGGTGLGLIICEKLVHLMKGSIFVESVLGQGTTFSFTIQTEASEESARTYINHNLKFLEGKRALIVDDNATNLNILRNQLNQWKFISVIASSAAEALTILNSDSAFDLIISDMQMPDMDGLELARNIKRKYSGIPIILLSSIGDEKTSEYDELFISALTKPVKQSTLLKHIVARINRQALSDVGTTKRKLSDDFAQKFPLRILIAEDNPVNQKLAERVLTKLGYEPDIVVNGEEALHAVHGDNYDVVLMDVQMPVLDGLEATRKIRERQGAQPVIIAMTANAMQGDREVCIEAGMNDYISKPIKLDDIIELLEKWAVKTSEVKS